MAGCQRRRSHLRSAAEQQFGSPLAGRGGRTVEVARACAFDLRLAAPELPDHDVPSGHTEMTWLRELTMRGAAVRYPGTHPQHEQAICQIAYELDVIEQLNFPGYFLVLVDIVGFCREHDIYCQGRGSAGNSAVCYALGVTRPTRSRRPVRAVPLPSGRPARSTRYRAPSAAMR
jgi:error-prone DNA polymerase